MDIIEKLFSDLESNNLVRVEDAKKRLSENFSLSKYLCHSCPEIVEDVLK